jgi:glycosyltransferase involved in cell wall biosynthesis
MLRSNIMRILYVNQWGGLGGAEISLLRVLERLPRDQVQPALACPPGALAEEARALEVEVFPSEFPSLRRSGELSEGVLQRLRDAVARCDLVHAYSVRAGWFAGRLCRNLRVPMVWSIHDLFPYLWQKIWLRAVAQRYAGAVVAYSRALQRQMGKGLQDRVYHIPHGVDTSLFRSLEPPARTEVRRRFGTPADVPVVIHVGRVMPFKGQHLFLQMAQMLRCHHPDAVYWLAGDDSMGDHRYALRVRAMSERAQPQIRWLGFQRDIAPVIAAADVLVHCSTRPEPFGLVILEAMACGAVVVSANRGAPAEILENGRTGILTPPNKPRPLADAVHSLLASEQQRWAIASSARRTVCERYTLEQHIQRLLALYQSLL